MSMLDSHPSLSLYLRCKTLENNFIEQGWWVGVRVVASELDKHLKTDRELQLIRQYLLD
jgi:hypothetical protein